MIEDRMLYPDDFTLNLPSTATMNFVFFALFVNFAVAYLSQSSLSLQTNFISGKIQSSTCIHATTTTSDSTNLTPLPQGISPFEKSLSKNLDVQGKFRTLAKSAVDAAIESNSGSISLFEIEFPPLIGGDQSKSQFDDFDNIQELDSNKDWTMQFAPLFIAKEEYSDGKTWLTFPDLKECELARKEWQGSKYQAATFTTIEAATEFLSGGGAYDAPWGAALANGMNKLIGGSKDSEKGGDGGLLGDRRALDELAEPPKLNLIIQPGNGGPVEDWINVEKVHLGSPDSVIVIVNGALDKVRQGYYPGVFFPKLAATVDRFYKNFESVFYLKPISDKGVYGWLYRVYPEPWQVVLQTVKAGRNGANFIENTVVSTSQERPSYNEALAKLLEGSRAVE